MYDLSQHGITQSLLSDYFMCRKMSKFKIQGWRPTGYKTYIAFGDAAHLTLENLYTTMNKHNFHPVKGMRVVADSLDRFYYIESGKTSDPDYLTACNQIRDVLFVMFQIYLRYYKAQDLKRDWKEQESQFKVNFKGFKLRGKRDGIFKVKTSYHILETKTKGNIDQWTLNDTLTFNFQNLFYITATELEKKIKVNNVLYNIIRRPQNRQGKKESYQEFIDKIKHEVSKKPDYYFIRYPLYYSEDRKRAFKIELEKKLKEFEAWLKTLNHKTLDTTVKNELACTALGVCDYLASCSADKNIGLLKSAKIFPELEE